MIMSGTRLLRINGLRHKHRLPVLATSSEFSSNSRLYSWKNFSLEDELTLEIKQSIEKKWYKKVYGLECSGERNKINKPDKVPAKYILSMFPYPSGRLHLGHVRVYTLSDVLARFYRLQGYSVVHPMGWDAFGLPAENAARENGIDAEVWTRDNINFMKSQIIGMGCCFDWEREFATCDPEYYKWTQLLFNKLWEKGLAYKKRAYVFWDPIDKTVLAEEQVDAGNRSWRSGAKVEKKLLQQWFIRTAVFAEKLSSGLSSGQLKDGWRDVVNLQDHWIGQIKGYFTDCEIDISPLLKSTTDENFSSIEPLRIWFSSVDSLKKATYFILRSDHFLLENDDGVLKTYSNGVKLMNFSISNPTTGQAVPVLSGPNDLLPYIPVSCDCRIDEYLPEFEYGELSKNDSFLEELSKIRNNLKEVLPDMSLRKPFEFYPASLKLRDWLISRQRKWGTPIPAVTCLNCGETSIIPSKELPIIDPSLNYSGTCSNCGSKNIKRETDTLDTFFDSSWYFFRYLDPKNESEIYDVNIINKFLPVHTYIGGKEHATLHLYYARFMTHFLHSLGLSPVTEPFQKLIPIGIVMGEAFITESGKYLPHESCEKQGKNIVCKDTGKSVTTKWEKMSKSKYNGIDPETVIQTYGIDTTRLLSMSEAAPTSARKWPPNNADAFLKWQTRCWVLLREFVDAKDFGDIVFIDDEVWQKSEDTIFDARNFYLKGINHDFSSTSQISVAISKLQGMLTSLRKVPKAYMKDSLEFERALGAAIIVMYPIMPAFSAQLWQSFRAVANIAEPEFDLDNEVWEQRWPSVDWRYQLDLICKVKGEEIIAKVERNYLDTLDEETALQIALDQPAVQKLFTTSQYEIVKFVVEPGFRATLTFREKKAPNDNDLDGSIVKENDSKKNLKA